MKRCLTFMLLFPLALSLAGDRSRRLGSHADSTWVVVGADTLEPLFNSTVFMRNFTVDTVTVQRVFETKHTTLIDSLSQWSRDADVITIDASKNANFIEMKDEGVSVAKFDTTGELTARDANISDATPVLNFRDNNATAGDVNASIQVDATDTGNGTEDADVTMQQQVSGIPVTFLSSDADGSFAIGQLNQTVVLNGATIGVGTISAPTLSATVTLGSELIAGTSAMSAWTDPAGWSYASSKWTHATGDATALVAGVWVPTASTTYRVAITLAASVVTNGITVTMGGITLGTLTAAGDYAWDVYTISTAALTFTPVTTYLWVGNITACSVKVLTTGGITGTSATLTNNNIGTLSTTYATTNAGIGLLLTNTTPAQLEAQQDSPPLIFHGSGWKTTATAASRTGDWAIYNQMTQGTTAPTSKLYIMYSANGGTWSNDRFILTSGGVLTVGGAFNAGDYITSFSYFQSNQSISATSTDGFRLLNSVAATAAAPVKITPRIRYTANVWDSTATAASKSQSFTTEVIPVSGGTVLPAPSASTARLRWSFDHNGGGYSEIAYLRGTGKFVTVDTLVANKGLRLGAETTTDQILPVFSMKGDADSDASAVTPETIGLTLVGAATPTNAYGSFTLTQGLGWLFDRRVTSGLNGVNGGFWTANGLGKLQELGGNGWLRLVSSDGDSLSIWQDGSGYNIAGKNYLFITCGTGSYYLSNIGIYPGTTDARSLGTALLKYQTIYGTDNFYLGGKGQTAKLIIGTQNTMTEETDSCYVVTPTTYGNISQTFDSAYTMRGTLTLADHAEWIGPTGVAGYGKVMIGNSVETAEFKFTVDGTVTLINPLLGFTSTNVGTVADVDAKLNICDNGSGIKVENELGTTQTLMVDITYFAPK